MKNIIKKIEPRLIGGNSKILDTMEKEGYSIFGLVQAWRDSSSLNRT